MTEFTMEWNVICRVCLQDGEMVSIYDADSNDIRLCDKIMYCASVDINIKENLPETICMKCCLDLNAAYRFRSVCESSNAILQSYQVEEKPADNIDFGTPDYSGITIQYKMPPDLTVKKVDTDRKYKKTPRKDKQVVKSDEDYENVVVKLEYEVEEETTEGYEQEQVLFEVEPNLENEIQLAKAELESGLEDGDYLDANNLLDIEHMDIKTESGFIFVNTGEEHVNDYRIVDNFVIAEGKTQKVRRKKGENKMTRPHMCDICGKTYRYNFNLEAHMRRHTGEKPFECGTCGKGFVISFELRRHMRCHTGVKPYQCKYCERKFSDFGSRIKHQRSHTGERPYGCETCGKTFAYSHVLSSHKLIHSGIKKYACEACGKRFTKSHHLKAHLNVHLRVTVPHAQNGGKRHPKPKKTDLVDIIIPPHLALG